MFDTNPELIGRNSGLYTDSSPSNPIEEFDRLDFVQKLYSLHSEDLGKIIIAIPNASQRISTNDTNARKLESLLSWAESGSGPGIEKVCGVAKKLSSRSQLYLTILHLCKC